MPNMSELKGQILGVLLVLMIFGGLIASYETIFNNATSAITERAENIFNSSSASE